MLSGYKKIQQPKERHVDIIQDCSVRWNTWSNCVLQRSSLKVSITRGWNAKLECSVHPSMYFMDSVSPFLYWCECRLRNLRSEMTLSLKKRWSYRVESLILFLLLSRPPRLNGERIKLREIVTIKNRVAFCDVSFQRQHNNHNRYLHGWKCYRYSFGDNTTSRIMENMRE